MHPADRRSTRVVDDVASLVERLGGQVVGRRRELELVVAALDRRPARRARGAAGHRQERRSCAPSPTSSALGFEFVEGNAELTPARLVGHFDPARVLTDGYDPDVFVDGPLVTAMSERLAALRRGDQPHPGGDAQRAHHGDERAGAARAPARTRRAAPGFRLVAAMNPFDAVGTARISGAVYDRVCRLSMTYQSAPRSEATSSERAVGAWRRCRLGWRRSVELVRLTPSHPDLRVGSSVRGAIDMCRRRRRRSPRCAGCRRSTRASALDAAIIALSGRVRLREGSGRTAEDDHHRAVGDRVRSERARGR